MRCTSKNLPEAPLGIPYFYTSSQRKFNPVLFCSLVLYIFSMVRFVFFCDTNCLCSVFSSRWLKAIRQHSVKRWLRSPTSHGTTLAVSKMSKPSYKNLCKYVNQLRTVCRGINASVLDGVNLLDSRTKKI